MQFTRRAALGAGLGLVAAPGAARAQDAGLSVLFNAFANNAIAPLFERYRQARPGQTVRFDLHPFGQLLQTIEVRLEPRTPEPDVFSVDGPLTASYAVRNHLMDLGPHLDWSKFTQAALDQATVRGTRFSAPFISSSPVLFYNRAVLERSGIAPPEADVTKRMTWEEIIENGRKITRDQPGTFGFLFEQTDRPYQIFPLIQSLRGETISPDGLSVAGRLDGAPAVRAMQFYQDMYTSGVSPPAMFDIPLAQELFGNGRVGYFVGGTFMVQLAAQRFPNLRYGVAPHPSFRDGVPVTPTGSWHVGINRRSRRVEAALDLVRWMVSDETGRVWFDMFPYPPTQRALWQDPIFVNDPMWRIVAYEQANTAVVRPQTPGYREYEDLFRQALRDIIGGANVQERLTATARQIDQRLVRYRG